jgi:MGT family glycosyltransferase
MSNYLLCSTPAYGHLAPMIAIGQHLVGQGHQVRMITGSRFADKVTAAGIEHISLPTEADHDDRELAKMFPDGQELTGIRRLQFDIEKNFIAVLPYQYRAIRAELARTEADAVLVENAFTGALPLLMETGSRPPVLVVGVLPLTVSSRDTAPFGTGLAPSNSRLGRIRNKTLNLLVSRVLFGKIQRIAQRHLRDLGVQPLPCFVLDGFSLADRFLQLSSAGFEYPRSDLRGDVSFVGPVLPAAAGFDVPTWWGELDGDRPVVLVTQGTVANADLTLLIAPTLQALADQDVLVVATTGDEASAALLRESAPANARVEAFVPYSELLDKVELMITNGGYGGVQFALSRGVPLVVAGDTEDKPEIAARVAWSGVGISLSTGSPKADAIAAAVRRVLTEPEFRTAAGRLRDELAATTPLETITGALAQAVDEGAVSVSR